jgi:Protein of unknown function (DUF2946)
MSWFRSNIKHGSRVALFALAIQFVLSFGHFHAIATNAAAEIQSGLSDVADAASAAALGASSDAQKPEPSNRDSDQQPADACAICAVISLAHTVLFAAPPLLLLPQAIGLHYVETEPDLVRLNSVHPAFQSRAPPIS